MIEAQPDTPPFDPIAFLWHDDPHLCLAMLCVFLAFVLACCLLEPPKLPPESRL